MKTLRYKSTYDPKTNTARISLDYNFMPKYRVDNMNPKTEGHNFTSYTSYYSMRIPSKKHKNRYKNFLKLFPNYKK